MRSPPVTPFSTYRREPKGVNREFFLRWLLAVAVFGILIFFFSPSWGAFRLAARVPEMQGMLEVRRGMSVLQQVAHPGVEIADPLHGVIQWRLLFPLIGHLLGLPPGPFFVLAALGCILVLGWIVLLFRRAGMNEWETGLAAVALGAASWFFTSCGWLGYFDSWLALGLLLVAFADARWVVWFACVWAPWVDERFVLAAPFALFCRFLRLTDSAAAEPSRFDWRREAVAPAVLLGLFLVVRLGLLSSHSAAGATVSGYLGARSYFEAPAGRIALGIWEGLRAGWIFVAAGIVLLGRRPERALALLGAAVVLIAIGLGTAQDYSRSMTMLLPAGVLGIVLAAKTRPIWFPLTLRLSAGAALLLPAHHVMNDRVNPIYYLYHELAVLENPPAIAMPELYELHAIHEMERGEFTKAEADLTLAIKLADNPSSPLKQRAILAASRGRWPDAQRDFSAWLERDPQNPDAWFMRAQSNLALGNALAAQSDLEHARSLAPASWTARPDVARFLATLSRSNPGK